MRGQPSDGREGTRVRTILEALAEALLPSGGSLDPGAVEIDLIDDLDSLIARFAPEARRRVELMALALELSPLFSRHLRPFSQLPSERREAFLRLAEQRSTLRQIVAPLKTLCGMVYCAHPRIAALLGYEGRPFKPVEGSLPPPAALPVRQYPELRRNEEEIADVAIVGSGAGGATVAAELARAGLSVVVIEEGPAATREDFQVRPVERVVRFYRENGLTHTLGLPPILVPMGCAVGGTTVVNSGTCFRTPEFVLHQWHAVEGIRDIEPERMAPLFEEIEGLLNVTPVTDDIMGRNGEILRRGAEALGVRHGPIRRPVRGCHGSGQCAFGCPLDAKQDMRLSMLPRAVQAGARLYARCRVDRIRVRNGRVTGVEAMVLDPEGQPTPYRLIVHAPVVVLAAGAIYTPWLLLRNRLGPRHSIGRNLRIHPGCGVMGLFEEEIEGWRGVMQSYYVDEWLTEGILLEATFPPPGVGYSAGVFPSAGQDYKARLARYRQMAAIGILVSDTGSGRVVVGPDGRPWMLYSLHPEDAARVRKAIALAARLLFAAGAREVYPGLPGLEVIRSEKEIDAILSSRWRPADLILSAYHPMGTCRMGEDPQRSVTDSYGAVHGVPGLWIADASLLPSSPVVNPQITIMALALRVARRILETWRRS
ncbi:putative GMC-type oxidoreductase [Candidatus Thermoflexus japonica]|uniref:Putative GMC-type oxidoreductase n=1 Tax=Candidatus Thermoflexus japonica TaxID=2035417 RepID=A0A2H5Y4R6_9CHLR|nr:putative GMC-type oxidoreductase [Candidatus Thermoflexus japonica]